MKTLYDASTPPAVPPVTDGVLIYAGGDTPHVWTVAEIARQTARYRLPTWVRSNPQQANPATDAADFIIWLDQHGAPHGTATLLDLETAIDPAFVNTFGSILNGSGYWVLGYGSSSTLDHNPVLNGYFVALPEIAAVIPPGYVAVQWKFAGSYDLDLILDSIPLWDTQPPSPPIPPPVPVIQGDYVTYNTEVEIVHGVGWVNSPEFVGKLTGALVEGTNPAVVGSYDLNVPHFVSVASQSNAATPNGVITFAGPVDGTYGVLLQFLA